MKKRVLIISLIITSLLLVFISYRFFNNVSNFNEHRTYVKKPINEQQIQDWMTINYLNKNFGIDLGKVLGKNISLFSSKNTLKEYCEKNKLDCEKLIILLENLKNGN